MVGARFPDETAAQLWVAKDTFHPLRLILPPASMSSGEGPVEIRYRNWIFTEGVAYPMHVVMWQNHQMVQEIRVDRLQVNPVLASDLFDVMALREEWSRPGVRGGEGGSAVPEAPSMPSIQ